MSKANKRERQRLNREARRQIELQIERRRRTMKTVRNFAILAVPVLAIGVILAATSGGDEKKSGVDRSFDSPPPLTIDKAKTYTATVATTEGSFTIALDAANAPTSVNNFVFLARHKFYDGLKVFRASSSVGVIQTGSPIDTNGGDPGYSVNAELPSGYELGSVAWAKGGGEQPGTAGSQWFVVTGEAGTRLPAEFGNIGVVSQGLDRAQKIEALSPKSGDGKPTKTVRIKRVTITESDPNATTTTAPATTAPASTAPPSS